MIAAETLSMLHPQPKEDPRPLTIEVVQDDGRRDLVTGLRRVRDGVYEALVGDRVVGSVHASEAQLSRESWANRIVDR